MIMHHYEYSLSRLLVWTIAILSTLLGAAGADATKTGTEPKIMASLEVKLNPNIAEGGVDKEVNENGEEIYCEDWAAEGECKKNPRFMLEYCAGSCSAAATKVVIHVYEGEDVGVAAFRFAEEYSSSFESTTETQESVLEVAQAIQEVLEEKNINGSTVTSNKNAPVPDGPKSLLRKQIRHMQKLYL